MSPFVRILCLIGFLGALVFGAQAAKRPNILVVMVDDLGFSDLGCYGSEIETPNLDALAANGLRFNQFYNTAKCHSSRISLLTGRYAIQAGDVNLNKAVTSAEVLGQAGYSTAMSGKWHLKKEPTDFGFDRYFGHLSGACNFYKGDKTFRLNGQPWQVPETGFYTTVAKVDYALRFLDEARHEKEPWYLYIAFNAPHAPLQPLKEDYEKYLGRYDKGWDAARKQRISKMKRIGLFQDDMKVTERPDHIPAWKDLPKERQVWEARRMTALAGMIDRVDQEMGRVIQDLKDNGELENTFILFVSDNGACPYDRSSRHMDREPYEPDVTWSDSTGWAWARNTPFRYYKQNQFEGGICTPGIVHWPAGLGWKPGSISKQPLHLVDVLPTLAEMGKAALPESWPDRQLEPVSGVSFLSLLKGKPMNDRPPIHLLFGQDRGLRDGDWKLVSFKSEPWELYNISKDRTELNNLASKYPKRVKLMSDIWHDMTENVLKAKGSSNRPVSETVVPHKHPEWTAFDQPLGAIGKRATPNRKRGKGSKTIRARKNTKLTTGKSVLNIQLTGEDGGLAMDSINDVEIPGPYVLAFTLNGEAGKRGELFFKTDLKTSLPKGTHLQFDIQTDGQWQDHEIELKTDKTIKGLRFDPGDGEGRALIKDLRLLDTKGTVVKSWP